MSNESLSLEEHESRLNALLLQLRQSSSRVTLEDVERTLLMIEKIVHATLNDRDVWHVKVLALRSIVERERASLSSRKVPMDPTTEKLSNQCLMVDRAMSQIEEARASARETASLLAENREKIESVNQRVLGFIDLSDEARGAVVRMKGRANRQCWLVSTLVVFLCGTVIACVFILVTR